MIFNRSSARIPTWPPGPRQWRWWPRPSSRRSFGPWDILGPGKVPVMGIAPESTEVFCGFNDLVGGDWLPFILFSHINIGNLSSSQISKIRINLVGDFPIWILGFCHHPKWRSSSYFSGRGGPTKPTMTLDVHDFGRGSPCDFGNPQVLNPWKMLGKCWFRWILTTRISSR